MFSLYSKVCEYTLRALVCGLELKSGEGFRVEDACRKAKVPESFTRKGFQRLAHQNIIRAIRGPGGGYLLTGKPAKISILNLVKIIDGHQTYEDCVMGLSHCGDVAPCPIHRVWKRMKARLLAELKQTTLKELMRSSKKKEKLGL